jgi:hypothetical protein
MKDGDLLRNVISQYAGKKGEPYHSSHLAKARGLLRNFGRKILDDDEFRIMSKRVIRDRHTRKSIAQELGIRQMDVKAIEIRSLNKLGKYYVEMGIQEKGKKDYEACFEKVSPLYSFKEFGVKARDYLESELDQLEQKYGDGLKDDVKKAIQGMLFTRDYNSEQSNLHMVEPKGLLRKMIMESKGYPGWESKN